MWKCPKCGRSFKRQDQSHYCEKPLTIDDYILQQDENVQPALREIREIIHSAIPDAEERISWSMPTFWKGRNIIHFAASKKHLGLYPGGEATTVFAEDLKAYDVSKGTIRIPWSSPLPADLISRITKWCFEEYKTTTESFHSRALRFLRYSPALCRTKTSRSSSTLKRP